MPGARPCVYCRRPVQFEGRRPPEPCVCPACTDASAAQSRPGGAPTGPRIAYIILASFGIIPLLLGFGMLTLGAVSAAVGREENWPALLAYGILWSAVGVVILIPAAIIRRTFPWQKS